VRKRLLRLTSAGRLAIVFALSAAVLSAQDPYPQVPPGGWPINGQNPNAYYPGGNRLGTVPYAPTAPTRPNEFPGGPVPPIATSAGANGNVESFRQQAPPGGLVPASYAGPPYLPAGPVVAAAPPAPAQLCPGTIILARVGNDVVLTSDLTAVVDDMIENFKRANAKRKMPPEKIAEQRAMMIKELSEAIEELAAHSGDPDPVKGMSLRHRDFVNGLVHKEVEVKLLYEDFRKTIPKENQDAVAETVARRFEEFQLKALFERENVGNRADLETALHAKGSSLEREKLIFKEQFLSQTWLQQSVMGDKKGDDEEVTHEEMLKWYQEHIKKFQSEPRVRWEELMISFARHPNHNEAFAAMAALGNRVLAGASFAEVARSSSEGPTARQGGVWDWTHKGSLSYEAMDQAIFNWPVGKLSEIIEAGDGYHIIRIIEREGLTCKSFLDVQKEIKESIKNERLEKRYKEFVEKVKAKYPIWTVFDNSMQQSNPDQNADDDDRYSKR
jgi:hypothetical protein